MDANINFIGNLTRDPEFTKTGDTQVCNFCVAVTTRNKGSDGQHIPNYYDCSIWGNRAEFIYKKCQKGTQINVDGKLIQEEFINKEGATRWRLRVVADSADPLARMKETN